MSLQKPHRHWLTYFSNPTNIGPLDDYSAVGQGGGGCGDLVRIYLKIDAGMIKKAAFLATGCPASIAGASACAEIVEGSSFFQAAALTVDSIAGLLIDIPAARHPCLELSVIALAQALERYAGGPSLSLETSELIAVGMSGGVDSSVAAAKLHRDGHQVLGVTLRLHDFGRASRRSCCTSADMDDARSIAGLFGFPHLAVDLREAFKREVIDNFCRTYLAGQTPNPCVECNRKLRFKHFLRKAADFGAARVATGHYVRIIGPSKTGVFEVRRSKDLSKDQSYMFWAADQTVLSRFVAPLGDLRKNEVRRLAADLKLPVAEKTESQDVCFIPDGDYAAFIQRATGAMPLPGPIVDTEQNILGAHRGLYSFTIGQRRGLGLAAPQPLYVLRRDQKENTLIVGPRRELLKNSFSVSELNLIGGNAADGDFKAQVMVRYNSDPHEAVIHPTADNQATVELIRPAGPIAPGQSAVFYAGDTLMGGGIIC